MESAAGSNRHFGFRFPGVARFSMVSGTRRALALPSRTIAIALASHAAHVADFARVCSLPADEIRTKTRAATLTSSWRWQPPARYPEYMSHVWFAARMSILRSSASSAP